MTASTPLADHIHQHIMDFQIAEFRMPSAVAVSPKRLEDLVLEGCRADGSGWRVWGLPLVTIDRREVDMVACICPLTG